MFYSTIYGLNNTIIYNHRWIYRYHSIISFAIEKPYFTLIQRGVCYLWAQTYLWWAREEACIVVKRMHILDLSWKEWLPCDDYQPQDQNADSVMVWGCISAVVVGVDFTAAYSTIEIFPRDSHAFFNSCKTTFSTHYSHDVGRKTGMAAGPAFLQHCAASSRDCMENFEERDANNT